MGAKSRRRPFDVFFVVVLFLPLLLNCNVGPPYYYEETGLEISLWDAPVAVGAVLEVKVVDGCPHTGITQRCADDEAVAIDASVEGPFSVVAVSPPIILLSADAEGDGRVTLHVEDQGGGTHTLTESISARRAQRAYLSTACKTNGLGSPDRVPVNYDIQFHKTLRTIDSVYLQSTSYSPFDASGESVGEKTRTRDTPGIMTITSLIDSSFELTLELFELAQVDSLTLSHERDRYELVFRAIMTVDGQEVCIPPYAKLTVSLSPPDACKLLDIPDIRGGGGFRVKPQANTGICRVEVSLDGTELRAVSEVPLPLS